MNNKNRKFAFVLVVNVVLTLVVVGVVLAATVVVDSFSDGDQWLSFSAQGTQTDFASGLSTSEVIGGERDVSVTKDQSSGGVTYTAGPNNNNSHMSLGYLGGTTGEALLQWDGSDSDMARNFALDADFSGNDSFVLRVIDNDYPEQVTLRAFTTDASNYRTSSFMTPGGIDTGDTVDIVVPFSDFTSEGSPDWADVDVVEMFIDTLSQENADVSLDFFHVDDDRDFGDLPATYSFASHVPDGLRLGVNVDVENSEQTSSDATGDDAVLDDEDGVTRQTGVGNPSHGGWTNGTVSSGNGGSMEIVISGGSGYPEVFIDWNNNGTLSPVMLRDSSGVALGMPLAAGTHRVYFDVPLSTFPGSGSGPSLEIRVRLSHSGGLSATGAASTAQGGEVEDYIWSFGPNAITLSGLNAQASPTVPIVVGLGLVGLLAVGALVVVRRRA